MINEIQRLLQAKEFAILKGGECLSDIYIRSGEKLEWKCANSNHPSWFSTFDSAINNKSWCMNCANEKNFEKWRAKGLKHAHQYAKTRGGTCLSTEFLNSHTKLEWKCSNPHHPSCFPL